MARTRLPELPRRGVCAALALSVCLTAAGAAGAQERVTFATLDKVTARVGQVEIAIGAAAVFGTLEITPRYCRKNPPEERAEVTAFVEVREELGEGEKIFSGWMFASSPGLHALEHPIYDLWVLDCEAAPG